MRITFIELVRSMTHDAAVLKKADFNKTTYHQSHLFCCRQEKDSQGGFKFDGCSMRYASHDIRPRQFKGRVQEAVANGSVCAVWQFENQFKDQGLTLQDWTSGRDGVAPDLLMVNGGLHYPFSRDKELDAFKHDFESWLGSAAQTIDSRLRGLTQLVVVSSTLNGWYPWERQRAAYELLREGVANLQPQAARKQTSYIDFHTLVGSDTCGFSTKFPARFYQKLRTADSCGHHYRCSDPHMNGGAYIHLLELGLNLMSERKRRCDPPPHKASSALINDHEPPYSAYIEARLKTTKHR